MHLVDVHILLLRDDKVLLLKRKDADPEFDGGWHAPSGRLEPGESVFAGACREAREEAGVVPDPTATALTHVVHVYDPVRPARLGVFFACTRWSGEPYNAEPDKASAAEWHPLRQLPEGMIAYSGAGIEGYRAGMALTILGFPPA